MHHLNITRTKPKVIVIGGLPATGKTTVMRHLLQSIGNRCWQDVMLGKLLNALFCKMCNVLVLGKYQPGVKFAGTDRLSHSVYPSTKEFISKWSKIPVSSRPHVIFEGDRLFTKSILHHIVNNIPHDSELHMFILEAPPTILTKRHLKRGDHQSTRFLKAQETKCRNISEDAELSMYITRLQNRNAAEQSSIVSMLMELIGLTPRKTFS